MPAMLFLQQYQTKQRRADTPDSIAKSVQKDKQKLHDYVHYANSQQYAYIANNQSWNKILHIRPSFDSQTICNTKYANIDTNQTSLRSILNTSCNVQFMYSAKSQQSIQGTNLVIILQKLNKACVTPELQIDYQQLMAMQNIHTYIQRKHHKVHSKHLISIIHWPSKLEETNTIFESDKLQPSCYLPNQDAC